MHRCTPLDQTVSFWLHTRCSWSPWGFVADNKRMFCLLTVSREWKCASSLIRRPFGRFGFSVSIPWTWRRNCKCTSMSRPLKYRSVHNLYEWRVKVIHNAGSAVHSCQTSDSSWCLRANRLGLRPTDANTRAVFSGVRSENSRPGGFLQVTEPSSRHCLTLRGTAFGDGASCWFRTHEIRAGSL